MLKEGRGEIPPYYRNFLYRRDMGLTWADLTGVHPQPAYITRLDRWCLSLEWATERKQG